jgi:sugar-specific transcriptional regulator TrmB
MAVLKNNLLLKTLIDFGLSEKEAKVYLALLELEVAAVSEIAKEANINRSTTYVILESLKKKGLVSQSQDKKVQKYIAVSPDFLLYEAQERAKKTEEIKNRISNIVPELKALYRGIKNRPIVKVFEGKSGLIHGFEDTLTCREKLMRVTSSVGNIIKLLPEYFPEYVQRRIKSGIKMHGIHPADEIANKLMVLDPHKFDVPILIPKDKYKIPADMAIYDDKIGLMTAKDGGVAILIQNKEIAEVMKNIFDLAFEEAKRLSKNNKKVKRNREGSGF